MRTSAEKVPLGVTAKVFGFTDPERWRAGPGKFYEGKVHGRSIDASRFLSTKITFADGATVYARDYAVATYEIEEG